MITVEIPNKHIGLFSNNLISQIIGNAYGYSSPYQMIPINRDVGRYLVLRRQLEINIPFSDVRYVVYSSNSASEGRNSYIAQYITPALSAYLDEPSICKNFGVYLFNANHKSAKASYQQLIYRTIKTLGFEILNECDLQIPAVLPFVSISDWELARKYNQKSQNNSSYIIDDGDQFTFFGKTFGANGMETAMLASAFSILAKQQNKNLVVHPVYENESKKFNKPIKEILRHYGVIIGEDIEEFDRVSPKQQFTRNQLKFKYHLVKKFGQPRCYLCECDIPKAIIASHIHRVADIKSDILLPLQDKLRQAEDGDNGFWFCGTHDKLFEHGLISFDEFGNIIISPLLTQSNQYYVNLITNTFSIEPMHLTLGTLEYLKKHRQRVGL